MKLLKYTRANILVILYSLSYREAFRLTTRQDLKNMARTSEHRSFRQYMCH